MSAKEIQAFETYYSLTQTGIKPSMAIQQIANDLDVTVRTIYKWKKKGQWDKKATERSIKATEELSAQIREQSDKAVKDFRKPYIKILNGLVKKCMTKGNLEINTVRELVTVMELSSKLQRELDMVNVPIISSEYSREKHIDEINAVLSKLKATDEETKAREEARKEDESRLQKTKILDPRQTDLRANGLG